MKNDTVLARIEHDELDQFFRGCGWTPWLAERDDPVAMHQLMAATIDRVIEDTLHIRSRAREGHDSARPRSPMVVLRSPTGWTGPCAQGIAIWQWASIDRASNDQEPGNIGEPDRVLVCCGDTPTLEVLAAASILREHLPELKVRVVNVVDLVELQSETNRNLHAHGYQEDRTITTVFDMQVQSNLDRFHLVMNVVDCLPHLSSAAVYLQQMCRDKLIKHEQARLNAMHFRSKATPIGSSSAFSHLKPGHPERPDERVIVL